MYNYVLITIEVIKLGNSPYFWSYNNFFLKIPPTFEYHCSIDNLIFKTNLDPFWKQEKKEVLKKVNCRSDEIFPDVSICCLALLSQTHEWEFWVSIWNWIWTKSSRSSTVLKWIPSSKLVTLFCQRRSNNPWSSFRPIS